MASLTPTAAQVKKVAALLDEDFESSTEAAKAVLELSWSLYQERAKFVVVAALAAAGGNEEPEAKVVVIGPYDTKGKVTDAALSTQLAAESDYRWIVPMFYGTPTELISAKRKARRAEAEAERDASRFAWLLPLDERDKLRAELNALVEGQLTLGELRERYPESGWVPAPV